MVLILALRSLGPASQVNSCKLPLHADLDHSAKSACELNGVNCTLHQNKKQKSSSQVLLIISHVQIHYSIRKVRSSAKEKGGNL